MSPILNLQRLSSAADPTSGRFGPLWSGVSFADCSGCCSSISTWSCH